MSRPTLGVLGPAALSALLAGAYLLASPPSTDLAAATFRAELFEREGFVLWNNAWYSGHHLLGYSVIYPPLAALVGVRVAGVLAVVAAAGLFAALARRRFEDRALLASIWFSVGVASWLLTGRMVFLVGVAFGLAALLAADARRHVLVALCATLTSLASPVAGLFLGLGGAAAGVAGDRRGGALLALPSLGTIAALNLAFPTDGTQPFPFSTFVAVPLLVAGTLCLVPREHHALRIGVLLYGLLCLVAFAIPTPVGSNAARLGALFAGPVAALVLLRRPLALALACTPLLYWQLNGPLEDVIKGVGDPATERAYFEPLLAELDRVVPAAEPVRIHVPATENRWEAAYVAPEYPLARGWLRQLESEDVELFTAGNLTADAYRAWLDDRGVSYVALADAELDYLAADEADLIEGGLEFLQPLWRGEHWQLFAVARPAGLVSGGGRVEDVGVDSFELSARAPGVYPLRVRHTGLWSVVEGSACVREAGGSTEVLVREPGTVRVQAKLTGDACSG